MVGNQIDASINTNLWCLEDVNKKNNRIIWIYVLNNYQLFLFWYQKHARKHWKKCTRIHLKYQHFYPCSFLKIYWHERKSISMYFRPWWKSANIVTYAIPQSPFFLFLVCNYTFTRPVVWNFVGQWYILIYCIWLW